MFAADIEKLAKENANFRQVLHTGEHSQIVAMSLMANEDIGAETHPTIDQTFIILEGNGEVRVGGETRPIGEDDIIFVPSGTEHNVINTGSEAMKLITIYAPAAHPDGTVHRTKADAQADE